MNKKELLSTIDINSTEGTLAIGPNGLVRVMVDKEAFAALKNEMGNGSATITDVKTSLAKNGKLKKTTYYLSSEGDVVGARVDDISRETLLKELWGPNGRKVAKDVLYGERNSNLKEAREK